MMLCLHIVVLLCERLYARLILRKLILLGFYIALFAINGVAKVYGKMTACQMNVRI